MFFIMGITNGRKDFDFHQTIICSECGRYGNLQMFMTYTVLTLFFIPTFKWNRHYYVYTSCCDTVYELDPGIGAEIARGEQVKIEPEDMVKVDGGGYRSASAPSYKKCSHCGYETTDDFVYCPKCGNRF